MSDAAVLRHGLLPGPWDQAFFVSVPGVVRSKSNFRRYHRGRHQGAGWGEYRAFEEGLALTLSAARPTGWELGERDEALAKRPVVVASMHARSALDAANVPKSVLDAAEGVLYLNDASVLAVSATSTRTRSEPGLWCAFARMSGPVDPVGLAAALAALAGELAAVVPES